MTASKAELVKQNELSQMCIVSLTSAQDELRRANGNLMSKHEETEDRLKSAQQTITELTDKYSNLIEVNNQLVARLK